MKNNVYLCIMVLMKLMSLQAISQEKNTHIIINNQDDLKQFIETNVRESYDFFGLAMYLNEVQYYKLENSKLSILSKSENINLSNNQLLIVAGRYQAMLVESQNLKFQLRDGSLIYKGADSFNAIVTLKSSLPIFNKNLESIPYNHLWMPMAWLAKGAQKLLESLHYWFSLPWWLAIITLSVLINVLLLPLNLRIKKMQNNITILNKLIQPKIKFIKAKYKGEEAHNKIMDVYKQHDVSPFYTLKTFGGVIIQIPIFIAVFNCLAETPGLMGQSFLWVSNLSLPDSLLELGIEMPFFGRSFNLLPVIMTVVNVIASILLFERDKNRLKLFMMALVFFILFYPFPSAMVLYWTVTNVLQLLFQKS